MQAQSIWAPLRNSWIFNTAKDTSEISLLSFQSMSWWLYIYKSHNTPIKKKQKSSTLNYILEPTCESRCRNRLAPRRSRLWCPRSCNHLTRVNSMQTDQSHEERIIAGGALPFHEVVGDYLDRRDVLFDCLRLQNRFLNPCPEFPPWLAVSAIVK